MSQLGQGTRPDHTYSMDWSKQFNYNKKKRNSCRCPCRNCSLTRMPMTDKAIQTESLPYEHYLEGFRGPGDTDDEIETEEHKVCVMPDIISHMDLKQEDEYQEYSQGLQLTYENNVASQESYMPEEKYSYQGMIRPCYIKDEVAPETNYVLQGCEIKYNFQNNPLPQQPSCICAERKLCQYGEVSNCNSWSPEIMRVDAEAQADVFDHDVPIKCIKCGTVLQDRSCCVQRYLLSIYECNECIARGIAGPVMTAYFHGEGTAASEKTVPCDYCKKTFGTTKGMRIHKGRVHKGIAVRN